jgi:hypothetical protein
MDKISAAWLYPIILIAGALQAWGPPMNNALKKALANPWLSSLVSFLPIIAALGVVWMCLPNSCLECRPYGGRCFDGCRRYAHLVFLNMPRLLRLARAR